MDGLIASERGDGEDYERSEWLDRERSERLQGEEDGWMTSQSARRDDKMSGRGAEMLHLSAF